MIYCIEGKILEKSPTQIIVETNNISYLINVSLNTFDKLPEINSNVKLFTHLYLKEDTLELYGFFTKEEKKVFELLIGTPGIGPKVALRILSGLSPSQLQQAVITENISFLTKIPGIGKKIGERLIVELKEPMKKISFGIEEMELKESEIFSDAVEALVVLGYKRNSAISAINSVLKEKKEGKINLQELIKEALQKI